MKAVLGNQWLFWRTGIRGVHTAEREARCRNGCNCCFGGPGMADW